MHLHLETSGLVLTQFDVQGSYDLSQVAVQGWYDLTQFGVQGSYDTVYMVNAIYRWCYGQPIMKTKRIKKKEKNSFNTGNQSSVIGSVA